MAKSGGQPGNTNGAKGQVWADAVRKALVQGKKLDLLAKKLIAKAEEGDMAALKEVGDRLDGKPKQSTEISGPDGDPIQHVINVSFD